MSILFLGKMGDEQCSKALHFCKLNFRDVTSYLGKWGDPFPEDISFWNGDYIISYLSRWIVPEYLLNKAKIAAINFHPASPDYPGIGCNNFALYEEAKIYGVTCHHMSSKVDTGKIITVKRFPIYKSDTVNTLLSRTYDYLLILFYEIMDRILLEQGLPVSVETWTRKPFSRKEFKELFKIKPDMSKEEVVRKIKAINFRTWKPYIELYGLRFEFTDRKE